MSEQLTNQLIGITSGRNFRELGGYATNSGKKIKYHRLLRTGNWGSLSTDDQTFLANYGVSKVIDFRSEDEVTKQPDRIPEGVQYIYDPVFSEDLTNSSRSLNDLATQAAKDSEFGFNHMLFAYEDMINSDSAQNAYRTFFTQLLTNETGASAFHCTAGKDRTGFAALLIMTALGVPLKAIKKDYLLTNITTKDFVNNLVERARLNGENANVQQSIRDIQSVRSEYFDHALKMLNDEYGSVNNYLRDVMKLSASDIFELRHLYLED